MASLDALTIIIEKAQPPMWQQVVVLVVTCLTWFLVGLAAVLLMRRD